MAGRAFDLSQARRELLAANPTAMLDWSLSRHNSGWMQVTVFYVQDMDGIGACRGDENMRYNSVLVWMYALASYPVDRERCARTDGRVFIEYLIQGPGRGAARFAATLPPERLQQAVEIGVRMEEELAPERSPRGHVCGYGVDDPAYDGASLLTPTGQAEPRVAEARRNLPRTLPALVGNLLAVVRARTPN